MINASKEFKEKLKKGGRIVNYADITLSNGTVLHLTYKDFMASGGCTIEDKTTDGKFGVGFTIGKTVKIMIANHDERFSDYDFYNSIINLYVAMQLDDGRIEKIRKGVYYSMVPATSGEVIEISAVDGMWKLDKDYSVVNTTYPATLQTIITDICSVCGIPIGFRHFDNMSFMVNERPYNLTCRRVLSCAAQIAGYNARIDNDGYMQLVWYNVDIALTYISGGNFKQYPHDTVIDGGDFKNYRADTIIDGGLFTDEQPEHIYSVKSLNVCTDDVQITGVRVEKKAASTEEEDTTILFGEEGYVIEVKENPLTLGKENEVANFLGGKIVGMMFRPFSAEIPGNPLYEPFDTVKVSDRKGNAYLSFLNSIVYTVGGYAQVACEAEDPLRNGSVYFSQAAAAVVEARRNAEQQITEYDQAVQNMTQLAMNMLGFFSTVETSEDGRKIIYAHDAPTLEESVTIYKMGIDGFFVSQDGGKSYTAGFDKNGNAVVNILYAIGIVADWIRSGRFEVKKGDVTTFLADADTGEVRIVADDFSLSSGETIDSIADGIAQEYYASLKVDINGIETNVSQLETAVEGNYSKLDSKITQKANEITLSVSQTYETKNNAQSQYSSFDARITANENGLLSTVKQSDYTGTKIASMISQSPSTVKIAAKNIELSGNDVANAINNSDTTIQLSANKINLTAYSTTSQIDGKLANYATTTYVNNQISTRVTSGEVSSLIEQSANSIRLKASNISWDSSYSSMTSSGVLTCTSGTIGGFTITDSKIYAGDSSTGVVVVQKPSAPYVFAAGGTSHSNYSSCPFRVTRSGKLYATNADVSGDITATSLKITGSLSIGGVSVNGLTTETGGLRIGNYTLYFTKGMLTSYKYHN